MTLAIVMAVVNCLSYTQRAVATAWPRSTLYLIDNGSTDGTREWAHREANAGRLRYLPQGRNIGVARAWNLGIRKALHDGHDRILVSNNDVVYAADTIPALEQWQTETGGLVTVYSVAHMDALENQLRRHEFEELPDFAGFMISRAIVDRVGYFDEAFSPAYFEDLDYVQRLIEAGIPYGRAADALVLHYHSRSIHEGGVQIHPAFEQNRERYLRKWRHKGVTA